MTACEEILVSVPSDEPERSAALAELRQALAALPREGFAEVWVDHDPFPALCALVNGENAWLMCVRRDGDPGFSSRNPDYQGPAEAKIAYTLANGQVDEYPAWWSYSRATVFEALESFARTRRFSETLVWSNDSGDGAVSPNDPPLA